ncbi:MAG: hypothetical protein R3183_09130 [Oleiphilaceae bacterium]|nr:hypothetical protein [Oleiphilaceae bacterium]
MVTTPLLAVQPLDEAGLGDVAADAGVNILNIYGASAAGITIDDSDDEGDGDGFELPLADASHNESEEVLPAAEQQLNELEKSLQALTRVEAGNEAISTDEAVALLSANEVTLREASVLNNNSEIRYQSSNFKHQLADQSINSVRIERDLRVDRLSLENLSGNTADSERSAGSIYISDWSSRGGTRITAD